MYDCDQILPTNLRKAPMLKDKTHKDREKEFKPRERENIVPDIVGSTTCITSGVLPYFRVSFVLLVHFVYHIFIVTSTVNR